MDEVSGPVIAIGLVLSAVFIPCVFITGIVGQFFRQFALTIAISTLISAFNSLTLSPALAVLLLKPRVHGQGEALPRLGMMLVAAWGAFTYLPALLNEHLVPRLPELPFDPRPVLPWVAAVLAVVVIFFVSRLINIVLLALFHVFNRTFHVITEGYVNVVGVALRG